MLDDHCKGSGSVADKVREGGCLCGAVRFEISGEMKQPVACHCAMCRKQASQAWVSSTLNKDDLRVSEDRGLKWYRSSDKARRGFCSECGSALFFVDTDSPRISVSLGALDGPSELTVRGHIYVADKGDYYGIADDLPQFPASDL